MRNAYNEKNGKFERKWGTLITYTMVGTELRKYVYDFNFEFR